MEIEKGYSINTSVVPIEWKDSKINFIDTPGYFDFVGEVNAAMRAAEAAVILVDAGAGVQVGTEAAWNACERYKKPYINFKYLDTQKIFSRMTANKNQVSLERAMEAFEISLFEQMHKSDVDARATMELTKKYIDRQFLRT